MTTKTAAVALLPNEVCFTDWVISDPRIDVRGGRSAFFSLARGGGGAPKFQIGSDEDRQCVLVQEEPSPARVSSSPCWSVQSRTGEDQSLLATMLASLDDFAIHLAQSHSMKWFGKEISLESIASRYVPAGGHGGGVRVSPSCNVYTMERDETTFREAASIQDGIKHLLGCDASNCSTRVQCDVVPCFEVRGIYFKTREMGVSVTCSDLLILPPRKVWPFRLSRALTLSTAPLLWEHTAEETHTQQHEDEETKIKNEL